MNFHHLIEINDPLNPLIEPLSRAQLWQGLVLRAEAPQLFMPHLDKCVLSERTATSVTRELTYGTLVVRDTVHFEPQQRILYEVPAQGEITASTLSMSIEEIQPGVLFVRFDYEDGKSEEESAAQAFYNEFRHSAYKEADIDTIGLIREMVADGRLDIPPA